LLSSQIKSINWDLNTEANQLLNKLGFIPLSQNTSYKKPSEITTKTSQIAYPAIKKYLETNLVIKDFEIVFDAQRIKMYSDKKEIAISVGLTKSVKYMEEYYFKRVYAYYELDKWGERTNIYKPSYKEIEKYRIEQCKTIQIILSKKEVEDYSEIKFVFLNGSVKIYVNDVLKISDYYSEQLCNAGIIRFSGNKVAIKNLMIKPILTEHNIEVLESTINNYRKEILSINTYFDNLKIALKLGESFKEYSTFKISRDWETNKNNCRDFVNKYPEFTGYYKSDKLKNTLTRDAELQTIKNIVAENIPIKLK